MDLGLKDKVAIVTGAGRGIGREVALLLASEGANLVLNELDETLGKNVVEEIERNTQQKAKLVIGDISQESVVETVVGKAMQEFGKLDILINNAGISPKLPFWEISAEEYDRVMSINARSAFLLSKAAFEPMKQNGKGSIVNLSSLAGLIGTITSGVHYSASKGAIIAMTKTLAMQMGPYNINVNCVAPGRIDTAMTQMLSEDKIAKITESIPLGRLGTIQEVASVIVFLASDRSSYLTGNCVEITGGFLLSTLK